MLNYLVVINLMKIKIHLMSLTFYCTLLVKQTVPRKTCWVGKQLTPFFFIWSIRTIFLRITKSRLFNTKSIVTSPSCIAFRSSTVSGGLHSFFVAYIIRLATNKSFSIPRFTSCFCKSNYVKQKRDIINYQIYFNCLGDNVQAYKGFILLPGYKLQPISSSELSGSELSGYGHW